jgi:hypothetical protein
MAAQVALPNRDHEWRDVGTVHEQGRHPQAHALLESRGTQGALLLIP